MKNLKKVIILSTIILVIIIYLTYNLKDNSSNIMEDDIFIETSQDPEETNTISLHITGEVNIPRSYRN